MSELRFRPLRAGDIPAAREIWVRAGIDLTLSDRPEELLRLLERNPDTCLGGFLPGLGADGEGDAPERLVATALGTWDGRRANLWHLAVDPDEQRRGHGRAIMAELERAWHAMGVVKLSMFSAEESNRAVAGFYESLGYHVRDDIFVISKILRED